MVKLRNRKQPSTVDGGHPRIEVNRRNNKRGNGKEEECFMAKQQEQKKRLLGGSASYRHEYVWISSHKVEVRQCDALLPGAVRNITVHFLCLESTSLPMIGFIQKKGTFRYLVGVGTSRETSNVADLLGRGVMIARRNQAESRGVTRAPRVPPGLTSPHVRTHYRYFPSLMFLLRHPSTLLVYAPLGKPCVVRSPEKCEESSLGR